MRFSGLSCCVLCIGAAAALLAGCGGSQEPISTPGAAYTVLDNSSGSYSPIKHVIIVIQENRTFDNLFATFPNADGTTTGQAEPMPNEIAESCKNDGMPVITQSNTTVTLTEVSLLGAGFPNNFGKGDDLAHVYAWPPNKVTPFLTDYDGGNMDGFDLEGQGPNGNGAPLCTYPYQYVNPEDITEYWDLARQYVLADHMFQTQGSGSFTAHQDLIAGGTILPGTYGSHAQPSVIDNPAGTVWGCTGSKYDWTSLISQNLVYLFKQGPEPPCFTYSTMRDLFDSASPPISWKYYTQKVVGSKGEWGAFQAIKAVAEGSEWGTKVVWPNTKIFTDLKGSSFPAVSWVTPIGDDSDHPQQAKDFGPSWVASIVNAVGKSKYWKSSAIVILWDDWGGFYDHEPPPFFDNQGGLGFRVPMIVVSPYVKAHVEHTQYEFGSILKFIEKNWDLPSLGKTDERATSIGNLFNFNQKPRKFKVIPTHKPLSFFLTQKWNGLPPDPE